MSPGFFTPFVPECVNAFIARLTELPVTVWLDTGRSLAADRAHLAARSAARVVLEATITDRGLALAAWYVCDAVDTVVCLESTGPHPWTSAERRLWVGLHRAAEGTALALLAQEHLTTKDFDVLCAPFAAYVPTAYVSTNARLAAGT